MWTYLQILWKKPAHFKYQNFPDHTISKNCIIAVCKDSYAVYARGFDQMGKWEWFAESMQHYVILQNDIMTYICILKFAK